MSDIVNPFIAGNPVTGPEMFFGREDVFQFIRQSLIGQHRDNVIVLYGQRRTGKTSVLYQMPSYLDGRYLCVFLDMHGFALEGLAGFLWELANHILRILRRDYQLQLPLPNRSEFLTDPRSCFENEFLTHVQSLIGERHILLMLDEAVYLHERVQTGKLEPEIFEYMRHLMQHYEWLNFLFSLGSGLEEMEKEYAFLFNGGLYKKISFLNHKAARDLITQPVKDYYQVGPAAVERIYGITSGHPYYMQLVCHCLFNCWQQRMSHIEVEDVDEVLNEVVERGSAVLKYGWEELTAGEKTIVAGMAAAMGESNRAIDAEEIHRAWRRYNFIIPQGEMTKAIRSLIARDVILGQEKYAFTVDLQRSWVQKYRRIEWVKEETADLTLKSGQVKKWLQEDPTFLVWHQELEKGERARAATNADDHVKRDEHKLFGGSDLAEATSLPVVPPTPGRSLVDFPARGIQTPEVDERAHHADQEKEQPSSPPRLGQVVPAIPPKARDHPTSVNLSDTRAVQSPVNEIPSASAPIALNQPVPIRRPPDSPLPLARLALPHHRPRFRTLVLLGLVILLLLLLPPSYLVLSSLHRSVSTSRPVQNVLPQLPAGIGVVKAPTGEYIGLSDGPFAFDTSRPDGDLKRQAADKIQANDFDSANYLWQQAVARDTNDAEALIYLEDLRVRLSGHPRLTIVIGTTLTGGAVPLAAGQANLRGAYIAQKEYNVKQKLADGVQVYFLIANSGSNPTYATLVAKQIAQVAQTDKTIVGVMGWTLDAQLLDALAVLAPVHLPMVSNTGTEELTGRTSYSFRVVASGARQGSLGAQFLEKTLHAKTAALFSDPQDDQSRGIAIGFTKTFTGDGNTIVATEHFTAGKPQTIPTLLQDALSKHPDAIYFAGRADDASTLLAHLRPADPPIMGPNAFYLVKGYTLAARPGLGHLHFTAGAYHNEWDILGLGAQKPPFFADFKAVYDPQSQHVTDPYGYDSPYAADILSYDATSVLLYGCSIALTKGPFLGSDLRGSQLWQVLSEVTGKHAFQGVSGAISFGPDGGVINKATALVCFDTRSNDYKMDAVVGQFLVGAPPLTRFPTTSVCT
jgi:ABC-type branched-subunit amino acid transport system substrate-binding protein